LDDPRYYDNFTLLGDVFSSDTFKTKYSFTAAFIIIANFSKTGFRLSRLADPGQNITPHTLNMFEILSQCGPLFMSIINKNKYFFDVYKLLDLFEKYFIVSNKEWSEKYVNVYRYESIQLLNNSEVFDYELDLLCSYNKWNPRTIIIYSSSNRVLNYDDSVLPDSKSHAQNTERIQLIKPNNDNLLDDVVENFFTPSHFKLYNNFLSDNYQNPLPDYMFTEYYIYNSTMRYNIPIIYLNPIEISKPISKENYVLPIGNENSDFETQILIPKIEYDTKQYYYDTKIQGLIHSLTDNYLEETYENMNLGLEDSPPDITLHLYKGNLFNIGSYDDITNTFTTIEKIRGYVSQPIIINWLIIETDYSIGDHVIIKETLKFGTVTGVSDDKYIITVLQDDDITESTYNQTQILKKLDIY